METEKRIITSELMAYIVFDLKSTGVLGTFGRNEGLRKFLSTLDQAILNRICPKSWKYISYGITRK